MKVEVKVPSVGESIVKGILSKWLKKNGDVVTEGETIFELETDKVNVEVPAPASGKIEIQAPEGDEVNIGQTVAFVDTDFIPEKTEVKEPQAPEIIAEINPPNTSPSSPAPSAAKATPYRTSPSRTSPSVRRIAFENNIDIGGIDGTGKEGRIMKEDVLNRLKSAKADEKPEERQTVVKMSPIRRTIAKNLVQAKQEAAHVTTFNEIDMEQVIAIRAKDKDEFMKKHGTKLGFMSFFVKACCQALKDFPDVNTMIRGDEIIYNHYYNIGVAVSVDEGLIVPVIKDADRLSFAQIEAVLGDLAERARMKKIKLEELQGGTFTITNGGIYGSMMSTPIPDFPQSAILGMHAIKDRPVVIDGKIVIKPVMYTALTYDHRVIDGKDAVEFLVDIKKYIEDPESLLIEL